MNCIVQPATTTDMRRDPKSLLERVKKEKVVPILVHSQFEAVVMSVDELNRLHEIIKDLKHELFVQRVLESSAQVERGEFHGPFDDVDKLMEHLTKDLDKDED